MKMNLRMFLLPVLALAFYGCIADSVCLSDADCTSPEFCDTRSGDCRVECREASDCAGAGYICRDNVCVLSGGPDGDAETDDDSENTTLACPGGMAAIEGLFCIDRYEAARADATADNYGSDNNSAPLSSAGLLPWMGISQADAEAACAKAGKRLCSPDEWYQACRGPDGQTYSYGRDYNPTTCNGIDTFCEKPEKGCGKKEADSGLRSFHITPSGDFNACTNEYGVFDINGNAWEWDSAAGGNARGGAYNCIDSEWLHRCDYVRSDAGTNATSNIGFRCCMDKDGAE